MRPTNAAKGNGFQKIKKINKMFDDYIVEKPREEDRLHRTAT